jgi:hypothetical protein
MNYVKILTELCSMAQCVMDKRESFKCKYVEHDDQHTIIRLDLNACRIFVNEDPIFIVPYEKDKEKVAKQLLEFVFTRGFENQDILTKRKINQ